MSGTSVSGGNCRTKLPESFPEWSFSLSPVRDLIMMSILSIASLSSCGVFAFDVARELHHWFGFTMSVTSSSVTHSAGRSFGGIGSHGIQLLGTLIHIFSTTQLVWNLSIQSACTLDEHHAMRIQRVSHMPVMIPSSPYLPWSIGMTSLYSWYLVRNISIDSGISYTSTVCPAVIHQSRILSPLRSATSRSVEIHHVRIAIYII